MNATSDPPNTVDAVSIGFDPSAIALACVLADARESDAPLGELDIRFLERAPGPAWHPESLLDGSNLNHLPLSDLVTPRNPRSRFSFAMYLKEKGRIFDLGLLSRPVSRVEWGDYISWVAQQVPRGVSYDETVREVLPGTKKGRLDHVRIETRAGSLATRNLVMSCRSLPRIPDIFVLHLGERVFHTGEFLTRMDAFGGTPPKRWLVLGAGQSAAESIIEISARQLDVEVVWVGWPIRFCSTQLDQFPNQMFSPSQVDDFHNLGHVHRRQFLLKNGLDSYAGIDPNESQKLFSLIYENSPADRKRLRTKEYHNVVDLRARAKEYLATIEDIFTGERTEERASAVVLATGYLQHIVPPLLSNLQPWLKADDDGGLSIDRSYRIAVNDTCDVTIFSNGLPEPSHGVSDGQSLLPVALRADRIVQRLAASPPFDTRLSGRAPDTGELPCFRAYRPL